MIDISIIIPVYNVEPYIKECLESVVNQHGIEDLNIECLIVDDCGKDNSIGIAKEFVSEYKGSIRFKIIYREKNGGLSAARNSGIKEAKGEYLFFLDSDDYLLPDALYNLYKVSRKYSGVELVQGEIQVSQPKEYLKWLCISAATIRENISGIENCRKTLLFDIPMTAWAKLIKRDFLIENNLYYVEGMIHEDDMWCLMASQYITSIACCFIPVYYYRINIEGSIMNNNDKTNSYLSYLKICNYAIDCYNLNPCKDYYIYIVRALDIERKIVVWKQVEEKIVVENFLRSLYKKIANNPYPRLFKIRCWYLKLNQRISFNRLPLFLYRRISRKLYFTQRKEFMSRAGR